MKDKFNEFLKKKNCWGLYYTNLRGDAMPNSPQEYVSSGFFWYHSPERFSFWKKLDDEWQKEIKKAEIKKYKLAEIKDIKGVIVTDHNYQEQINELNTEIAKIYGRIKHDKKVIHARVDGLAGKVKGIEEDSGLDKGSASTTDGQTTKHWTWHRPGEMKVSATIPITNIDEEDAKRIWDECTVDLRAKIKALKQAEEPTFTVKPVQQDGKENITFICTKCANPCTLIMKKETGSERPIKCPYDCSFFNWKTN